MTARAKIVLAVACAAGGLVPLRAQPAGAVPAEVLGVGVTEHLDGPVPLDLPLVGEDGRPTTLSEGMRSDRPLVLVLAYYECPMLCTVVLNGVVEALSGIDWVPGREFDLVTLSIDPDETPELAREKKQKYIAAYGRPEAAAGWRFLTGPESSIRAIASAVGFEYRYVADRDEFAHPAVVFVLTPEGRVARYLYGVRYDPQTLRLSLVEAAQGKVGSTVDRILLTCFRYDAETGRYTPVATGILRIAAILTVLVLAAILVPIWVREARAARRKKRLA